MCERMLGGRIEVLERILCSMDPEMEEGLRLAIWRGMLIREELRRRSEQDPTSVMSIVL